MVTKHVVQRRSLAQPSLAQLALARPTSASSSVRRSSDHSRRLAGLLVLEDESRYNVHGLQLLEQQLARVRHAQEHHVLAGAAELAPACRAQQAAVAANVCGKSI